MYPSIIINILLPASVKILGLSLIWALRRWRKIQLYSKDELDQIIMALQESNLLIYGTPLIADAVPTLIEKNALGSKHPTKYFSRKINPLHLLLESRYYYSSYMTL